MVVGPGFGLTPGGDQRTFLAGRNPPILLLDAMGVIYVDGEDVKDLLIPFVIERGGIDDPDVINAAYHEAYVGQLSAHDFWERVGLSHELEDEYLTRLTLTDDLPLLLEKAASRFRSIYCLSNDVSDWSFKLRRHFGLEPYFSGWYISGDLRLRKPDPAIFRRFLDGAQVASEDVLFVDDRPRNLIAAEKLGFHVMLYDPQDVQPDSGLPTIHRLTELLDD
jgi:putative hydrolase of the HAD superfamily